MISLETFHDGGKCALLMNSLRIQPVACVVVQPHASYFQFTEVLDCQLHRLMGTTQCRAGNKLVRYCSLPAGRRHQLARDVVFTGEALENAGHPALSCRELEFRLTRPSTYIFWCWGKHTVSNVTYTASYCMYCRLTLIHLICLLDTSIRLLQSQLRSTAYETCHRNYSR